MTYSGFQRFDECQAYYRMKREQREDKERQAEFDKYIERQYELDIESKDLFLGERQIEKDIVNEESK